MALFFHGHTLHAELNYIVTWVEFHFPQVPKRSFAISLVTFLLVAVVSIVLLDLRCSRFYIAITFVSCDDDPFWRYLAAGHLEGCRDGAVLEQTFSRAACDRNYNKIKRIDEVLFKDSLKHICASEYVQIRAVRLF